MRCHHSLFSNAFRRSVLPGVTIAAYRAWLQARFRYEECTSSPEDGSASRLRMRESRFANRMVSRACALRPTCSGATILGDSDLIPCSRE
jgi:hypothetical protein